ncbi:transposase [Lysinibacillus sphaericus]|nr:transposase [Lysinibacillus sphaericus]
MCDVLDIPKSTYYYHADVCGKRALKTEDKEIARIFKESRNNYGTRKIKKELSKLPEPKHVSRRRIGRLMKGLGLVSNYTVAQYKLHHSTCNETPIKNELQRQFEQEEPLAVIVSD